MLPPRRQWIPVFAFVVALTLIVGLSEARGQVPPSGTTSNDQPARAGLNSASVDNAKPTTSAKRPPPPAPPSKYLRVGAEFYNKGEYWKASKYLRAAHDYRDYLVKEEQVMLDVYLQAIRRVPKELQQAPATTLVNRSTQTPAPPNAPTSGDARARTVSDSKPVPPPMPASPMPGSSMVPTNPPVVYETPQAASALANRSRNSTTTGILAPPLDPNFPSKPPVSAKPASIMTAAANQTKKSEVAKTELALGNPPPAGAIFELTPPSSSSGSLEPPAPSPSGSLEPPPVLIPEGLSKIPDSSAASPKPASNDKLEPPTLLPPPDQPSAKGSEKPAAPPIKPDDKDKPKEVKPPVSPPPSSSPPPPSSSLPPPPSVEPPVLAPPPGPLFHNGEVPLDLSGSEPPPPPSLVEAPTHSDPNIARARVAIVNPSPGPETNPINAAPPAMVNRGDRNASYNNRSAEVNSVFALPTPGNVTAPTPAPPTVAIDPRPSVRRPVVDAVRNLGDKVKGLWNAEGKRQASAGYINGKQALAFSPDGSMIAGSTGPNGEISIWNTSTKQALVTLPGAVSFRPAGPCFNVTFSTDGRQLVGLTSKGLIVHDLANPAVKPWEFQTQATSVSFSPDGSTLAVVSSNGDTIYCKSHNGQVLGTLSNAGRSVKPFAP